jgi:hypothetical protein
MRRLIQLKKAASLAKGEHVLIPQHPNGILLARKITSTEMIDGGKRVEIGDDRGILHVLGAGDTVATVE